MAKTTGLILSGGGARAAYQVGVLAAIAHMRRAARLALGDGPETAEMRADMAANPFPIISGTSAGAINAAVLACGADDFDSAMAELVDVWGNFHVEQVYDTGVLGMVRSGARWLSLLSLGWLLRQKRLRPKSLLNNDPQFGVTRALVGDCLRHDEAAPEDGVEAPWYTLDFDFTIEPGESRLPKPPIK